MASKADLTYARLLEAILFIAERPVAVQEIKSKLNIKKDEEFARILGILKDRLSKRKSFIQIIEVDQGRAVQMRLETEVKRDLDAFRTKRTISKELLGTLAFIALKQPMKYSDLRKIRGGKVKEHVEALEKEGFIKLESSGRTKVIVTTLYFASVFNLDPDNIKETFKEEIKKRLDKIID